MVVGSSPTVGAFPTAAHAQIANESVDEAYAEARLAQSVERKALNLVVVGSSPTVGAFCFRNPKHSKPTLEQ